MTSGGVKRAALALTVTGLVANLGAFGVSVADEVGATVTPDVQGILTPAAHRRGVEQTFLTFPEWFLVFSPAEYAEFVKTRTPDDFVFWGHIGQFWKSYAAVAAETRHRKDPSNPGYHLMINVIGISTTIEYALRSFYETLVGRLTAATLGRSSTAEDRYGAQVAQEYVDFIRVSPWYEFDFWSRLKGLWSSAPAIGPHMPRKWERRYALTSEYVVKAVYGKLIEKATRATYDVPKEVTAVVLDAPACARSDGEAATELQGGEAIALLPRYQAFTPASLRLASCGAKFREIAGNNSVILVSAVGPTTAPIGREGRVLFVLPILTQAGMERRAYVVPVAGLGDFMMEARRSGLTVEHVFDY